MIDNCYDRPTVGAIKRTDSERDRDLSPDYDLPSRAKLSPTKDAQ